MTTLLGIIVLHLLVMLRSKIADGDGVPYGSVVILSLMTVGYVFWMMHTYKIPEP